MDAQLVEAKVCVFLSKGCFAGRICRLVAKFLSVLQIRYVTCHRAFHICIKTLSRSLFAKGGQGFDSKWQNPEK